MAPDGNAVLFSAVSGLIKKAIMGGKVTIILLLFVLFWDEGFKVNGGKGGEGHQKAIQGISKQEPSLLFDEKTLNYSNFR